MHTGDDRRDHQGEGRRDHQGEDRRNPTGADERAVPPSVAVVEAVAAEEDVPQEELDCILADVIDPGALDTLFTPKANDSHDTPSRIQFGYCGYTVTVRTSGEIVVRPAGD